MERLHRAAYAVVWVNPVKGSPDYQPLAAGMRAALPSIDRFVAGHNLASLEALGALLAGIERRHAADAGRPSTRVHVLRSRPGSGYR